MPTMADGAPDSYTSVSISTTGTQTRKTMSKTVTWTYSLPKGGTKVIKKTFTKQL